MAFAGLNYMACMSGAVLCSFVPRRRPAEGSGTGAPRDTGSLH